MKPRRPIAAVLLPTLLLALLLGAARALWSALPSPAERAARDAGLRYASDAPLSDAAAPLLIASTLGHRGLAADWRYVKAVLMIGEAGRDYRGIREATPWAYRILEEALVLDPHFDAPLRLGAVTLALHDRAAAADAQAFARRVGGRYRGADAAWKPPLWEGQAAYFAGDFSAAVAALRRALQNGGPPWIEGLIAHAAAQSGGETRTLLASAAFLRAIAAEEKKPDWKAATLAKADMLDALARLREAALAWRARHGRSPDSVEALAPGGLPPLPGGLRWTLAADGLPHIDGLMSAAPEKAGGAAAP